MEKLSVRAALIEAAKCHGPLTKWGCNEWSYNVKTPRCGYFESSVKPFRIARQARARSIAEDALILLGFPEDCLYLYDLTGEPRNIVRAYIKKHGEIK